MTDRPGEREAVEAAELDQFQWKVNADGTQRLMRKSSAQLATEAVAAAYPLIADAVLAEAIRQARATAGDSFDLDVAVIFALLAALRAELTQETQ